LPADETPVRSTPCSAIRPTSFTQSLTVQTFAGVFGGVLEPICGAQSVKVRHCVWDILAGEFDNLKSQTNAALQQSSILIGTVIGDWRNKAV
jgi:hypothetical protein